MRKEVLAYVILAIIVGASAVMLPLQVFKAVEKGQTQTKRSILAAEEEKPLTGPEKKEVGHGKIIIQNLLDVGVIISIGVATALAATLFSKRLLTWPKSV
ncbi:hypothetical protein J7L06_02650 [Candidatus Bathyarchaeota archaeon]|nr:hypothetical protein [Candidatus Bathyarchaeota archaeon]